MINYMYYCNLDRVKWNKWRPINAVRIPLARKKRNEWISLMLCFDLPFVANLDTKIFEELSIIAKGGYIRIKKMGTKEDFKSGPLESKHLSFYYERVDSHENGLFIRFSGLILVLSSNISAVKKLVNKAFVDSCDADGRVGLLNKKFKNYDYSMNFCGFELDFGAEIKWCIAEPDLEKNKCLELIESKLIANANNEKICYISKWFKYPRDANDTIVRIGSNSVSSVSHGVWNRYFSENGVFGEKLGKKVAAELC